MIKKKIAIICNYELLEDRVGGMDYFFWSFNKACKERYIEVDWFFPNLADHGDYNLLKIIPSNTLSLEQKFIEYMKAENSQYSHIFTHFIELCTPFFETVKKHQKAKIIAVDHNPRPLDGYTFKKRIVKKIKGILFSRYIDVFVGVSEFTRQALLDDFGSHMNNKVVVILNGLNVGKFIKKTNFTSHNTFIVASHLRKEKGIQDLILAVKNLKAYRFTIDIYGKGYYEDTLKKMVQEYSLQNIIVFKGSVSNLHELYCTYDYLIHPSHGETFCYSVVESLLSNLPVITTKKQGNVLGLVEENNNGFLFEAKDITALSSLLQLVIKGEKHVGINTSTLIENKFLIETMVKNYLKLIHNN
jgi:glycosyltransferase involved in cell wall biosynthesis